MTLRLLFTTPMLLAAAQPAAPPAPAAPTPGTVERDAQCLLVLASTQAIMQRNTTRPPPAQIVQEVREAVTFYAGRLGARYPAGRIGPALLAARATLPPRGPEWLGLARECGLEFGTLARAVAAEVNPVLNP